MNWLEQLRARLAFVTAQQPTARWAVEENAQQTTVYIYGAIGGMWGEVTATNIVPAIRATPADHELVVYVNSPGGDVYEGVAIRNAIKQHPGAVTVVIDGLAASAASFIATAGDTVLMGDGAEIMIHDAWTIGIGNADELRDIADDLDRLSDTIAAFYAEKAGGEFTEWRALMKQEVWYSAEEAVEAGLADELARDRADADAALARASIPAASFDLSMYAHAGRTHAPAPRTVATLAHRKDPTVNREQLAAALKAGTISQAQYDAAIATLNLLETPQEPAAPAAPAQPVAVLPGTAGQPVDVDYAAGPQNHVGPRPIVTDRPKSFAQVHAEIKPHVEAQNLGAVIATINNALEVIDRDDDAGHANFGRPEWLGEIWQARTQGRPYIESLGGVKPMTGLKVEGWRWARRDEYAGTASDTEARVQQYAGKGADVPTGIRKTKKVEADGIQWGVASAVERILVDLGDRDLTGDLFSLLAADFDADSDAWVREQLLAAVTNGGEKASIVNALAAAALDLKAIGATLNTVRVSRALFEEFAELKISDLPAWLANQLGFVSLTDANATVSSALSFDVDFGLTGRTMVAYDRRAATVRQSPNVRLEANNIGKGTVEIGFFAYGGFLMNDNRAARSYTIAAAPAAASAPTE